MPLPRPVTTTDELLLALHTEVVGLRADLAARGGDRQHDPDSGPVEVREPGRKRIRTGSTSPTAAPAAHQPQE